MRCFLPSDSARYAVLWTSDTSFSDTLWGSCTSAAPLMGTATFLINSRAKQSLLVHRESLGSLAWHCSHCSSTPHQALVTVLIQHSEQNSNFKAWEIIWSHWRHRALRVLRNILGRLGSRKGWCFSPSEVGAIPMRKCPAHFRKELKGKELK